jgi:pimeloyl-ACP methyl ester carboxylesterase
VTKYSLPSGIHLDLEQQGQGSTTIVLLHGLASTKNIWYFCLADLAKAARIISFDQRGHGLSSKPEQGYSWKDMCDDLKALLDDFGLVKIILVGHSWGADVALNFAARFPEYIESLCLVDGGIINFNSHLSWLEAEKFLSPPDNYGVTKENLIAQFPDWLGTSWKPSMEPILLSIFEEQVNGTYKPRLGKKQHMEIVRALWEEKPFELYSKIACPTTVLMAIPSLPHEDYTKKLLAYRKEGLEQASKTIGQVKTVVLEDTIHDIPLQRPELLVKEILALL